MSTVILIQDLNLHLFVFVASAFHEDQGRVSQYSLTAQRNICCS
jgi:hypothetical protein